MGFADRYTILKKVADGGMAEIFLATQTGAQGFERTVVCKRILPELSADPQFRHMLVDEAHIAMGLNHSNIVQVFDLGEAEGRTFLVLELVDGWDLSTILGRARAAKHPLPPALALYVTAEICRALAYAHGRTRDGKPMNIVHRDISPHNVLLSDQGEVKLTDFGIAKALGRRERTRTGVIKGKLDFMSPEQAAGAPIDARSDIFATGSVLYTMVTGAKPFSAASDLETLLRVQSGDLDDPQRHTPNLAPSIRGIILKAMRKAPRERYASADEMMGAVERVLREELGSAGQSDLKRWLEDLGRRDGVASIARTPGLPIPEAEGTRGKTLALRGVGKHGDDVGDEDEPRAGRVTQDAPEDGRDAGLTLALAETAVQQVPPGAIPGAPIRSRRRPRGRWLVRLVVVGALAAGGVYLAGSARKRADLLRKAETTARKVRGAIGAAATLVDPPAGPAGRAPRAAEERADPVERRPEPPERRAQGEGGTAGDRPQPGAPAAAPSPAEDAGEARRSRMATADRRAPALTEVRLDSRPPGAVIHLEKRRLGATPTTVKLRPGARQEVVFSKPGYADVRRTIDVGTRPQRVAVVLSRRAGKRTTRR
jgi:hypothetical protein